MSNSKAYIPIQNVVHQNLNKVVNRYEKAMIPFANLIQFCDGRKDEEVLIQAKHIGITVKQIRAAHRTLGLHKLFAVQQAKHIE